ncbi:hypothetical protein MPNT_240009 [Candidatus Methylacidithermus pantelleriae]|uniref:Uncharacterized protein n=1 Tax=Candidatus Methylacidithermus pantelleriae TaxID=2744239 RepID=A0A8J2BQ11_9BACT|nr:hypothetical protein MPNT_240009 [Candidatus Methylacidithermus pantelleriae]
MGLDDPGSFSSKRLPIVKKVAVTLLRPREKLVCFGWDRLEGLP